ncbi:MAG: DNA primase small subunit domain-containing protein [Promethearchaeota archaeon]
MIRHKGYQNQSQFLTELKRLTPRHVYASAAVYKDPIVKKMSEKGWQGCDFVIDIDSDHMDLPCQDTHDYYFCMDPNNQNCNYYNKGKVPEKCPECGGKKFFKQPWLCDKCLSVTKEEIFKLIDDFLIPDFGIELNNIEIVFSGHRGYHLHVYSDKTRKLDSNDRRQIVDYLTGTGLKPPGELKWDKNTHSFTGTKLDDPGWRGRIAHKFYKILEISNKEAFQQEFSRYNLNSNITNLIFDAENRKYLLNQLKNRETNWSIKGRMAEKSWSQFISFLIELCNCEIDVPVSIDIHRLMRLQGSIHGKTGFLVKPIDYDALKEFDPLEDSVIFSTDENSLVPVRITAKICPSIRIKNNIYGPYDQGEKIKIPEAVGVFLACKGAAIIEK